VVKFVGWLLIVVGALLIVSVIFAGLGIPMVGLGIVILVAVALVDRHAEKAAERERERIWNG
jgi:hypothetical protein